MKLSLPFSFSISLSRLALGGWGCGWYWVCGVVDSHGVVGSSSLWVLGLMGMSFTVVMFGFEFLAAFRFGCWQRWFVMVVQRRHWFEFLSEAFSLSLSLSLLGSVIFIWSLSVFL